MALIAAALPAAAQDATWLPNPGAGDYSALANWDTNRVPTGNTPGRAAISKNPDPEFHDTCSAGSVTISTTSDDDLRFFDSGSAGGASISNHSSSTTPARPAAPPS